MQCKNCGAQLAENTKFCTSCGTRIVEVIDSIVPTQKVCGSCGAPIMDNAKFCTSCGASSAGAKEMIPADMGEKPIYTLDGGVAKILKIYEDHCVLVAQKNFMSFMTNNLFNGDKEFYYSNLTSVQFKLATNWINGYIQFEYPGSHSAGNDFNSENSFAFRITKLDNATATNAVNFIKEKIKASKVPTATFVSASPADELKKFKELLDSGVISQEEFDLKKKQLLGL